MQKLPPTGHPAPDPEEEPTLPSTPSSLSPHSSAPAVLPSRGLRWVCLCGLAVSALWALSLAAHPLVVRLAVGSGRPEAGYALTGERHAFIAGEPVVAQLHFARRLAWHHPEVRLLSAAGATVAPDFVDPALDRVAFAPATPLAAGHYRLQVVHGSRVLAEAEVQISAPPEVRQGPFLDVQPGLPPSQPAERAVPPGHAALYGAAELRGLRAGELVQLRWFHDGTLLQTDGLVGDGSEASMAYFALHRPDGLPPGHYRAELRAGGLLLAAAELALKWTAPPGPATPDPAAPPPQTPAQPVESVQLRVGVQVVHGEVREHQARLAAPPRVWASARVRGGAGAHLRMRWYRDGQLIWQSVHGGTVTQPVEVYSWRLDPEPGRTVLPPGEYRAELLVNGSPFAAVPFVITPAEAGESP